MTNYNFTKEELDSYNTARTTPIAITISTAEAKSIICLASAEAIGCAVVRGKEEASKLVAKWGDIVDAIPDTFEDEATIELTLGQLGMVFRATEGVLRTDRRLEEKEIEIPYTKALRADTKEVLTGLSDKIVKAVDKVLGINSPIVASVVLDNEEEPALKTEQKTKDEAEKAEPNKATGDTYTMAAFDRATAELDEEAEVMVSYDDLAMICSSLLTMKSVTTIKAEEMESEEDKLFCALHDKYLESAVAKTESANFTGEKAMSFTAGELSVIANALDSVAESSERTIEKMRKDKNSPLYKVLNEEYLEQTIRGLRTTHDKIMEALNPMLEESQAKFEERKAKDNCASEPIACNTDDDLIMDKRATLTMTRNDAGCIWRLLDGIVECMHDNGDEELFGSKLFAEMAEKIVDKFDRVLKWAIDNDKEDVNIKLPYGYWAMLPATLDAVYNAMLKAEDGELDTDMRRLITEAKTIGGKIMYDLAQKARQEHEA